MSVQVLQLEKVECPELPAIHRVSPAYLTSPQPTADWRELKLPSSLLLTLLGGTGSLPTVQALVTLKGRDLCSSIDKLICLSLPPKEGREWKITDWTGSTAYKVPTCDLL
jgi:hypothetical protein